RLARNNTDWYRLLDPAGMTDTLIADADGGYPPAPFNPRLRLGMEGTPSGAWVRGSEIIGTEPTYHAVHNVLTHPAYAGAYTFGRTRQEKRVSDDGAL